MTGRRTRAPSLGVLVFLLAAPASAGVFEVWTQLSLRFANLGRAQAAATSTGLATLNTSSSSSSHLSTIVLPALSLQATVPITDPLSAPQTGVIFSVHQRPDLQGGGVIGNVSGAIGSGQALTPHTFPATGGVTVCLLVAPLPPCLGQLDLPLGATSAGQQIGVGVGGFLTVGPPGTAIFSVLGAPWTVETVTVSSRTGSGALHVLTARGFAHGPASLTSSTALTGGVLQIVTPVRIPIYDAPTDVSGMISRILVHVIPEPSLLTLLGSGAALVAWLGWRRHR